MDTDGGDGRNGIVVMSTLGQLLVSFTPTHKINSNLTGSARTSDATSIFNGSSPLVRRVVVAGEVMPKVMPLL